MGVAWALFDRTFKQKNAAIRVEAGGIRALRGAVPAAGITGFDPPPDAAGRGVSGEPRD